MKVTELNNQFITAYQNNDSDEIVRLAEKERSHLKASSVFANEEHEDFNFGLLYSIRLCDVKKAKSLLGHPDKPNIKLRKSHILAAAALPDLEMLDMLVQYDNEHNTRKCQLMIHAADTKDIKLLSATIDNGANPSEWHGKCFYEATERRNWPVCRLLLEKGFVFSALSNYRRKSVIASLAAIIPNFTDLPDGNYTREYPYLMMLVEHYFSNNDDTPLQAMMNVPSSLKPALLEYMALNN